MKTLLLLIAFISATATSEGAEKSGTERMAERLHALAKDSRPDLYSNTKLAAIFHEKLIHAKDNKNQAKLRFLYAAELLNAGESEKAIHEYESLLHDSADLDLKFPRFSSNRNMDVKFKTLLLTQLGIAHLRLGEQQNCIAMHNHASCIFPIAGHGVHMRQEASSAAVKDFTLILKGDPTNLEARWFLNLAYMTLGQYPDQVPKRFLYPPKLFQSEREFPHFEDLAAQSGVKVFRGSGSVIMDDFDGDGNLDLIVSSPRLEDQIQLFHNNGKKGADFRFEEYTDQSGLVGITGGKNIIQADFDNDGCLDFFMVRGAWKRENGLYPNSLIHNKCNSTFEDVTEKAGLLRFAPTDTAAWWDYDNDGWVDLIVPHQTTETGKPHGLELWHNNKDGTFTEVSKSVGLDLNGNFTGVTWGDYDNDGRGDLFFSDPNGRSRLFHNDGPGKDGTWHFSDVTVKAGLPEGLTGRTTWFFDFDNDGYEDLFVSSGEDITLADSVESYLGVRSNKPPHLFKNNHDGTFTDVAERVGLGRTMKIMGGNFGDLDNDGYLDIYFGTGATDLGFLVPNRMFWNDHGKKFLDVTTAGRFGHLQKGHGIAFGDVDGDGYVDVFAQMGGAYEGDGYWSALFHNPGNSGNWLRLHLQGTKSNRSAIGARIRVNITEDGKSRDIYRTVNSGGSRGSNPLEQHIGLGKAKTANEIEIFWPASNSKTLLENVKAGQRLTIVESKVP